MFGFLKKNFLFYRLFLQAQSSLRTVRHTQANESSRQRNPASPRLQPSPHTTHFRPNPLPMPSLSSQRFLERLLTLDSRRRRKGKRNVLYRTTGAFRSAPRGKARMIIPESSLPSWRCTRRAWKRPNDIYCTKLSGVFQWVRPGFTVYHVLLVRNLGFLRLSDVFLNFLSEFNVRIYREVYWCCSLCRCSHAR